MRVEILIPLLVATTVSSRNYCHACFDGFCYARSLIIQAARISGQVAVDRKKNILYFHYIKNSTDYTAAYDLDDIRSYTIPKIDFSHARTVDQTTGDVYMSGVQGIYKYEPISNQTNHYGLFDKVIWSLQFKNSLYYTIFKTKGLFNIENKKSKAVPALSNYVIEDFVIDKKDDIYFMSNFKIHRLSKGSGEAKIFLDDNYILSTDKFKNVFFASAASKGLHKLDYGIDDVIRVGVFGRGTPVKFVFDKQNNIIYHDADTERLYYLMPNYGRCRVSTNRRNRKKLFISIN